MMILVILSVAHRKSDNVKDAISGVNSLTAELYWQP